MKYFAHCESLNDLKAAYRKLAIQHHPDLGGDTATMQEINAEHDTVFEVLKRSHNARAKADTTGKTTTVTETAEQYRTVLNLILPLDGLIIELCGSWLWISGDTKDHKDALKAAGCRWAPKKKMWYWSPPVERGVYRGKSTIDQIRDKYGSERIVAGPAHARLRDERTA